MVMVRLPDAGKMHFMHSDQQFFSGGGPRHPAWTSQLRYSQGRAQPDMVPSAPQAKNPSYAPGNGLCLHITNFTLYTRWNTFTLLCFLKWSQDLGSHVAMRTIAHTHTHKRQHFESTFQMQKTEEKPRSQTEIQTHTISICYESESIT